MTLRVRSSVDLGASGRGTRRRPQPVVRSGRRCPRPRRLKYHDSSYRSSCCSHSWRLATGRRGVASANGEVAVARGHWCSGRGRPGWSAAWSWRSALAVVVDGRSHEADLGTAHRPARSGSRMAVLEVGPHRGVEPQVVLLERGRAGRTRRGRCPWKYVRVSVEVDAAGYPHVLRPQGWLSVSSPVAP